MNEKYLWELWERCKHPHPKFGGDDMVWPIEFAELIVQECMACSTWVGNVNNNPIEPVHTAHAINQRIRQHFGVEE